MNNEDNQIRFKTSILRASFYDYSDAYILVKGKTSRILWEYCKDEPVVANNANITDFNADNITSLFDLKEIKPY